MFSDYVSITMLLVLFVLLLSGFPVAFTLAGVSLIFGLSQLDAQVFNLLPLRIWGIMNNFNLLAIPLFIFMGVMLEKSGIAEDLLTKMAMLFGRSSFGLPFSVIISGAILAASTGIVGASVVTMGLISLPLMLRQGFKADFSSGVICSSGTLGQIIPPSIVLVILGDIIGVPVGELFIAAIAPGLLLVCFYLIYSFFYCKTHPHITLDFAKDFKLNLANLLVILKSLFPTLILMLAVLGSIFAGIASPTEAASVGAFGAILLWIIKSGLKFGTLKEVLNNSVKATSMVFMILVGATSFGLVFRELGGDEVLTELVLSLPHAKLTFLIGVLFLLFILGCFLDFIEIVFIIVPILVPIISELEINRTWFAILIALNLQTSFLTPPLGFSLFYLKGVAPDSVKTSDIYRGIIPFVLIQLFVLFIALVFPDLILFMPKLLD